MNFNLVSIFHIDFLSIPTNMLNEGLLKNQILERVQPAVVLPFCLAASCGLVYCSIKYDISILESLRDAHFRDIDSILNTMHLRLNFLKGEVAAQQQFMVLFSNEVTNIFNEHRLVLNTHVEILRYLIINGVVPPTDLQNIPNFNLSPPPTPPGGVLDC